MTMRWLHWTTAFPHLEDPQNGLFVANALQALSDVDHRILHVRGTAKKGTAPLPKGPWNGIRIDSPGGWTGLQWKRQVLNTMHDPVDALVLHMPNPDALPAVFWAKKQGIPVFIVEHRSAWIRKFSEKSAAYRLAMKGLFQWADGIAVPSDALARALREAGISRPIATLGNPLPVPVSRKRTAGSAHRFGHLGDSIGSVKGQPSLLAAWETHVKHFPSDTLEICGDGPDRAAWEQAWGPVPGLTFLPGTPHGEVLDRMLRWDTVVVNSPVETFGLAAAEALDRGCTVLSTRNGGMESWGESIPALYFRPRESGDVEDLVAALAHMRSAQGPRSLSPDEADAFFAALRPNAWARDFQNWIAEQSSKKRK